MSWCKAHTLRERIVRTSLRACHENRNRKNLVKLVLQKISLYRERVVTCPRQTRSPDRPSPLITDPLIGIFRYERGERGMDRGGINGIRGIALPRTDPRQPRGARGGRDSLEITTPSRDDLSPSLSRALSRVPPTSLYASMHPFAARLRLAYLHVSQLSRSSLFIPNNVRRSHRFSSEDEKSRPRNIEITGSSHQSTEPFCALSNTNSAWVDVAGRLPDFIPGYTLSSQSTIFLTSSSRRSYTAI